MILESFEYFVLMVLNDARPKDMYGITIYETLSALKADTQMAATYNILNSLEKKCMVSSYWVEPIVEHGGSYQRFYRLERKGIEALIETKNFFQPQAA